MQYDYKTLRRSQDLRKNMTKEERHLWYDFLKKYPVQFKRQYPIGCYFADFFCYKAGLIVELDGSQHCDSNEIEYDNQRTAFLQEQGYCVLRFSNLDVMRNFRSVCTAIDLTVTDRLQG
ncbi:MAG: endonuclease domain-containing protein [Ruminococcaceae bacterium]|nr:endonuclease domain-containing protein [Oscillospiraceae bacterium]